eukprot:3112973-Rhodomonas_salina.1
MRFVVFDFGGSPTLPASSSSKSATRRRGYVRRAEGQHTSGPTTRRPVASMAQQPPRHALAPRSLVQDMPSLTPCFLHPESSCARRWSSTRV